jgi:DNA adenine methylase
MVELDDQVAAVWHTILRGDVQWLVERIVSFELTPQSIREVLSQVPRSMEEKAFQTILRNRINHGGILAPGAGVFKYGESGRGLKSRWYPQTLKQRILLVAAMKDRITFVEGDGLKVLREKAAQQETVFFIDPPYTAGGKNAGRRLYTHSVIDHEELFHIASSLAGDFLMTYEDNREIRALAGLHGFDMALVAMQNRHHAKLKELLIGKDLGWLRSSSICWGDA